MNEPVGKRVIHAYDTERHEVLCGVSEQTNSTKHPAGVTCVACRELLGRAARTAGRVRGPQDG